MTTPAATHAEDQRQLIAACHHLVRAHYHLIASLTDAGLLSAAAATALIARYDQLGASLADIPAGAQAFRPEPLGNAGS